MFTEFMIIFSVYDIEKYVLFLISSDFEETSLAPCYDFPLNSIGYKMYIRQNFLM